MQTAVTLGRDHLFIRNVFANSTGFNRINPVLDTLSEISGPVFSSPEPLGSQGKLIVYPSVVRPPFSKIFSSETAWPIKAKFYLEPPWEGGTKVCINGPGHMTKMATTPIYGNQGQGLHSHFI